MPQSFRPPLPGENIVLLCRNCGKIFRGPNPLGMGFRLPSKKPKCPACGSRRVIKHPGVMY